MAAAAAMAVMIAAISCVVTVLYQVLGWWLTKHTQAWRKR